MKKLILILKVVAITLLLQNILVAQTHSTLIFNEPSINNHYGYAIDNAGDVNGDGYSDIIIGAPNTNFAKGNAYVYFGGTNMNTVRDVELTGQSQFTDFGISVSGAGDVNGDGYDDVLIGATGYNSGTGRVYIFYGGLNMNNLPDVILNGETPGSYFGCSLASGDVNKDGYSDLIIGASEAGKVYIYFGGINMNTFYDVIFTTEYSNIGFGSSVASGGDVNGDGYSDVILGAYNYNSGVGRAYIHFGSADMDNIPDVIMTGVSGEDHGLGFCLTNDLDVNNDGYSDVLLGNENKVFYKGKAKLFYGGANMDNTADKVFMGDYNDDGFAGLGTSVSGAGDLNNDGYDEIIIGAPKYGSGIVYVYYGGVDMNTTADLTFRGEIDQDYFGFSVASAGDINSDSYCDLLVGASGGEYSSFSGKAYLFYNIDYNLIFHNSFIKSVSPNQNEINVKKTAEIKVVFKNDMNASTINSSNIRAFGYESGLLSTSISYNSGSKTATIIPNIDFRIGEKIQITLTSGIKISSDNTPIDPFTWTFTAQALSGTGVFTEVKLIDSSIGCCEGQIVTGDFNRDGNLDIAKINLSPQVKVYFNDGNANFVLNQIISSSNLHDGNSLASGDMDNDGDIDLFLSFHLPYDSVYVYKNNGSGMFTQSFSANYSSGYRNKPVVGDFDSDGDLDIVSIDFFQLHINLFINDGNGNLSHSFIPYNSGSNPKGISSGDFDNDGDLDLITLSSSSKLIILVNNGYAYFEIWHLSFPASNEFCPTSDFDSDRDIDVATRTNIYLNDGLGFFSSVPIPFGSQFLYDILPADFDADGDIDNAYICNGFTFFPSIIAKNNGLGSFTVFQNLPPNSSTHGVSGDLDGDGDIDLAIDNMGDVFYNSNISIQLNNNTCGIQFSISGSTVIPVGSENNVYISSADSGYWSIFNYDSTQASIPPNSERDTVLVSAGDKLGHFVLYYTAHRECGVDTLLSYHVYVDYPSPVELSSFTSSVSGRDVTLNWSTSNELNNSGFDIERAVDNGQLTIDSWSKAGYVEGNGTVSEPRDYTFTDNNLQSGNYKYRLKQKDFNGNFEYFELDGAVSIGIPDKFSLSQNYPNPFNPVTNIEFGISSAAGGLGFVTLKIYDAVGREVVTLVNEIKEPGYYTIKFNAANLASGVYFYRMTAGEFVGVRKMVVLK